MRSLIGKYHLNIGLLLAVTLPGLFVFQETIPERMVIRFVSSCIFIFSLWSINFILVDFNQRAYQTKKWYLRLVLAFVITTLIYIVIGFTIDNTETMLSQVRGEKITSPKAWFYLIVRLSLLNGLVLIIKYLFDSNKEKRRIELENAILKRENLAALHEVMKQQLKPHFLFNSLTTLKSLVSRHPEQAVNFISELSAMYRYMLLHQLKDIVDLREEVEFAKSYLVLLEIRYGAAIQTEVKVPEEFLSAPIPPNTLQLLIENAVKHNSLSQQKPLCVSLFVKNSFLIVQNNVRPKRETEESSGIGLSNIENRYKLLFDRGIEIEKTIDFFQVSLPLINIHEYSNH
ncbi:MAG TPA: histidine kinase [Cyclobacteriaceae bacterium]